MRRRRSPAVCVANPTAALMRDPLLLTNDAVHTTINPIKEREIEKSMMVVDKEAVEEGGESNCNTINEHINGHKLY